jgi:hypothetical protein
MKLTIIFQNKESFTVPNMWVTHTRYASKGNLFSMECNPKYASIMEQDSVICNHNKSDIYGTFVFNDVLHIVRSISDVVPNDIIKLATPLNCN